MSRWEAIADQLRSAGWMVSWFSFIDRDNRVLWRVRADKDGGPHFTIQADNLGAAVAELEAVCREAQTRRAARF